MNRYPDCRRSQINCELLRDFCEVERIRWSAHHYSASVVDDHPKALFGRKTAT
jgi:hypothetical protein